MKRLSLFEILFIVGCYLWPVLAIAETADSCSFDLPPSGAVRKTFPTGMTEIKYPDLHTLSDNYTGCLRVWYQGQGAPSLFTVVEFKAGETISVKVPTYGLTCEYKARQLVDDTLRHGKCPEGKDVTLDKWRID